MQPAEAARRVREYERTLDARTLWPGVTQERFAAAMGEIVRVAAAIMASPQASASVATPVPGGAGAFGPAAFASGLGPLLGFWIETGRLRAPAELADLLGTHLDHGRRRATRLRTELERIVAALGQDGIEVTVLKGMHTGWAYFPDPGTRPASDIDLLIPPRRAPDAFRRLEAAGFRQRSEVAERTTWEPPGSAPPASVDLTHADNPWTLDLHVTLDRRLGANAALPARFDARDADVVEWRSGSLRVGVLSQPLLSCFLAVHATDHFPYVSPLRLVELLLVFQADGGPAFPWAQLAERFERTRLSGFGYPALKLVTDLVPGVVDEALLTRLRQDTPPRVRALAERLTPATALQLYRRSFEARFLWSGSGWQRVRAIARWLWPRDSDGERLPIAEALRATARRVRRLATGLLAWRHQ
jgi:hypothetical protein